MSNDQQTTYLDLLEETADCLTNIKEGADISQFNVIYAEVALRCVEEKIGEVDGVLTKMRRQAEMESNLEYLIKKMDTLDIKMTKLENKL